MCARAFCGLESEHKPYVPFWTDTASPGQHWAELVEKVPPGSEVCGHRAWPPAYVHREREGKKTERERERREERKKKRGCGHRL